MEVRHGQGQGTQEGREEEAPEGQEGKEGRKEGQEGREGLLRELPSSAGPPGGTAPLPRLAIANRNYSSWSLRAWLYLRLSGIAFETVRLPMETGEWDRAIGDLSPSGRLPALLDGEVRVWDSFAIILHLLEHRPGALGWPRHPSARAEALSVCAEMHSGFAGLRREMPFNCRSRFPGRTLSGEAAEDVARVQDIWESCRSRFGSDGPYLFGELTVADVMYAPVALRFVTYGTALRASCSQYVRTLVTLPEILEWVGEAEAEAEVMEQYEPPP